MRMTGQPPNQISQSPERGRHGTSRSRAATNGRLAGAAAMLTHGVGGLSPLHHWRFGLLSRHTLPHSGRAAFFPHSCYSRAVKGSACSVANLQGPRIPRSPRTPAAVSSAGFGGAQPHQTGSFHPLKTSRSQKEGQGSRASIASAEKPNVVDVRRCHRRLPRRQNREQRPRRDAWPRCHGGRRLG